MLLWDVVKYPLLIFLMAYGFEEYARFNRHRGECVRLVQSAKRAVKQPECTNPLTRIDGAFVKCKAAGATVDEGTMVCAVRTWWAQLWVWKALGMAADVSYTFLVAAAAAVALMLYILANAWVADRQNNRQVQLMRDSMPMLMNRRTQQPIGYIQAQPFAYGSEEPYRRRAPEIQYIDE